MKKHSIFILVIISLAVAVGVWRESHVKTPQQAGKSKTFKAERGSQLLLGTVLPQHKPLPEFTFIDQENNPFDNAMLKNKWSFLFFGYTKCPELCPTTLMAMANLSQRVGANPNVQYLFVSITPDLDTPEQLKAFFSQDKFKLTRFIGLTGDSNHIHALASELGIYIAEETDLDIEHLGHSGTILLINPQGALHALFTSSESPHRIAHDFKSIMSLYARG